MINFTLLTRTQMAVLSFIAMATVVSGCTSKEPNAYPVSGKISIEGEENELLAGHVVEASLVDNPLIRAYGEINQDGRFDLETLQNGEIIQGAAKGEYLARIVFSDDDPAVRKQAAKEVPKRYLDFESSGLKLVVPADESVHFDLKRR